MGSQRFAGKTMYNLAGKPALQHLLDSVTQIFAKRDIFVATSVDPANDIIEAFAGKYGVHVYRGSENNVAERFLDIVVKEIPDFFIRLNADSPLLDYRILATALAKMETASDDIVTTVIDRTFPSGMNVEILKNKTFVESYPHFNAAAHFEHVTKYFYENRNGFRIESLPCPVTNPHNFKFTFDTTEDKKRLEAFFSALPRPHYIYNLEEKCGIYKNLFGVSENA